MIKKAIITGITGQDGAYLAQLLLEKGYKVYGTYRRTSSTSFWRAEALGIVNHPDLELIEHDITDSGDCFRLIHKLKPDEVYNLAAQSFVEVSFSQPTTTAQITGLGALNMLEGIRNSGSWARFYQASTSELYGNVDQAPQNEDTPFYPRSPYGVSKLFGHWITRNYQESYNIFACSGILFNHESPVRGREFVTRKITDGVARIRHGLASEIRLGNLNAQRDWGFARDYVEGMYRMLQADTPKTYVLATGRTESVRTFAHMAFAAAGLEIDWRGEGVEEVGVDRATGKTVVCIDDKYYRPADVHLLIGDAGRAHKDLGWQATTTLEELCTMMVQYDDARIKQQVNPVT